MIIKPIATDLDDRVKHIPVNYQKEKNKPTIIDNHKNNSRIGAFEVQYFMKWEGKEYPIKLFSKLETHVWPNITMILRKII